MTQSPVVSPPSHLPAMPAAGLVPGIASDSLAQHAVDALVAAAQVRAEEGRPLIEERAVYRPDSWLLQKCWEALANAGAAPAAMDVAAIVAERQPLARIQVLYRLSQQLDRHFGLAGVVARELARLDGLLFSREVARDDTVQCDRLVYAAATAATIGEPHAALAYLERLDQLENPWERPIVVPEQRQMLSDTIFRIGPHPLTMALLANALRRFGDAGAQFVLAVTTAASTQMHRHPGTSRAARLLALGVDTFRHATTLTSLHSRRLTATVFAQAGMVDELLAQLTAIANIQAARRESGLSLRKGDQTILRQVKRPTADADVDFQVYALREAIRAMPVRQLPRDQRIELANRLAMLGTSSDGWTAAGAAASLIELGAVKFAVDVVNNIPENDPTRAEGFLALVRGLLEMDEPALAEEQLQKALEWAQSYPGRNPERAFLWGMAETYLERREPDRALALLECWQEPTSLWRRMRNLFGRRLSDDELRNNGLRLRALMLQDSATPKEIQQLASRLSSWAPRLLDGEALINYLLDDLLRPLLAAGRTRLALSILPTLQAAMDVGSGEKHAMRVAGAAQVLAGELGHQLKRPGKNEEQDVGSDLDGESRAALEQFLVAVWQTDARRSLWQAVHGIEGSLPLVIALDGPEAVVDIARAVDQLGHRWG
ncbi:MAG: hypothetical protein H3C34_18010 [Caldilineaceae bacterium]|nr:hypothetical protein [Caldilineaceae bacterium]